MYGRILTDGFMKNCSDNTACNSPDNTLGYDNSDIAKINRWLESSDAVVLGAGSGLSAAAGLFVSGKKGPVIANYGLENCSFFKPVYSGDTITVYLTAKEKINRGVKGRNIPSGVVKWLVEVVNQRDEIVCVATILTLVAKKSPFVDLKTKEIQKILNNLTENSERKFFISFLYL